jgi:hypothetical protein
MNTKPEALRLADAIDGAYWEWKDVPKMATELRRLHEIEKLFLAYKLEQEAMKEKNCG